MTAERFKKRFVRLYPKLFAIAMANMGDSDEAKDVVQSLFLKLWEKRGELEGVDNDVGYCRRVLLNMCRDRWRARSVEPAWAGEDEDVAEEVHDSFEADDVKEKIEQFIAHLPERQRRIMTMRMQGATTEEIIEATGLSVENVRTILSRTRQLVREFYKRINR